MAIHVEDWLRQHTQQLASAGITTARLDCLVLLEDSTAKDRAWLLAHPEYEIPENIIDDLHKKVIQRSAHLPLSYIRGRTEFYGRNFYVDKHVLEPRPESETLISLLSTLPLPDHPVVVDVGTGSGALAITAKLELPEISAYGVDIDRECLRIATKNAADLHAEVTFIESDLLTSPGLPAGIDVILANLPYVPDSFHINSAAMNEPRTAIFGGPDGLDVYRRMFGQIDARDDKPSYILTEALPPQHEKLAAIAASSGYGLETSEDFIQVFKLAAA